MATVALLVILLSAASAPAEAAYKREPKRSELIFDSLKYAVEDMVGEDALTVASKLGTLFYKSFGAGAQEGAKWLQQEMVNPDVKSSLNNYLQGGVPDVKEMAVNLLTRSAAASMTATYNSMWREKEVGWIHAYISEFWKAFLPAGLVPDSVIETVAEAAGAATELATTLGLRGQVPSMNDPEVKDLLEKYIQLSNIFLKDNELTKSLVKAMRSTERGDMLQKLLRDPNFKASFDTLLKKFKASVNLFLDGFEKEMMQDIPANYRGIAESGVTTVRGVMRSLTVDFVITIARTIMATNPSVLFNQVSNIAMFQLKQMMK